MKNANFSPAYCAIYPKLTELVRGHGYALAVHGSMARDFDLVCIPWVEYPDNPEKVIDSIVEKFAIERFGHQKEPALKQHGRLVYTLNLLFGDCFMDLSFMPIIRAIPADGVTP
jgi:hypothetical protein